MELSLSKEELQSYIASQLEHRFPDRKSCMDFNDSINIKAFEEALQRVEYCFKHVSIRGYSIIDRYGGGVALFNHLHSDQFSQFLYYFSNSLWKTGGDPNLCSKLILLNRELHGCWFSYKGNLPDIFLLVHPVGSVIGNANVKYSDYLVILQNVTINGARKSLELGECLFLGAGAKIIGEGKIGDRVSIGANSLIRNPEIPSDSIVYQDVNTGIIMQKSNKQRTCLAERNYFRKVL